MPEERNRAAGKRTAARKKMSKELRSQLEKAIWYDRPEELRSLLAASDIDVNERQSRSGRSLLDGVASRGVPSCLPVLLEAGADVNSLDEHRRTALFQLLSYSDEVTPGGRREIFDGLVAAGLDLHAMDRHEQTALHWAAGGSPELLKLLLAHGLDPNACDEDVQTPLFEAARSNSVENVRLLLAAGAEVDARNWTRDRALHLAAHVDAVDCVALLLAAGADPNLTGKGGETPLFRAATYGRARSIELLIAAGADVNVKSKKGLTPLEEALENGREDACLALLASGKIDQGALDAALVSALRKGMDRMVTALADAGADTAQRVNGKPLSSMARTDAARRALRAVRTARVVESAMTGEVSRIESPSSDPGVL